MRENKISFTYYKQDSTSSLVQVIHKVNKSLSSPQTQSESFSTESFGFNFLFQFILPSLIIRRQVAGGEEIVFDYNAFGSFYKYSFVIMPYKLILLFIYQYTII